MVSPSRSAPPTTLTLKEVSQGLYPWVSTRSFRRAPLLVRAVT